MKKIGIEKSSQNLFFEEKELVDSNSLFSYKINNNSKIKLIYNSDKNFPKEKEEKKQELEKEKGKEKEEEEEKEQENEEEKNENQEGEKEEKIVEKQNHNLY